MAQVERKSSIVHTRLYLDIFLFIAFVLVNIPQSTGIPFHEWISVLFIVPLVIHILLDWQWVVSVTKRIFKRLPGEVRANHIIDLIIFVMMVLALFTGFLISEAALPALGIDITIDPFWSGMHDLTANLTMIFIGVHLAMHWKWIKNGFNKYIFKRQANRPTAQPQGGD